MDNRQSIFGHNKPKCGVGIADLYLIIAIKLPPLLTENILQVIAWSPPPFIKREILWPSVLLKIL